MALLSNGEGSYDLNFESRGYNTPVATGSNYSPSSGSPSQGDTLLDEIANRLANGGGGGGGSPDWYYQGNLNNDTRGLDLTEQNNKFNQDFSTAQFNWQKTLDDRDYALRVGDFELAKQKQADANYWQQKTLEAQQSMNAADNASAERRASIAAGAEVQSASISAQAQIRSAEIRAAVDREAANKQLQANLANAVNDADRNAAYAAWNQEQAAIAKMEDDTKRQIAANDAKINLFGAETDRMNVAGQLAQKQNEFILNAATSPRDLFGLYFMQRGVAPDWETLSNGGTPGQGSPLVPQNALTAYVPQSGLPQLEFGTGPAYGNVGQATGAYKPQANPYIAMGLGGGGGAGGGQVQSGGQSYNVNNGSVTPVQNTRSWAGNPDMPSQQNIPTDSIAFNAANGFGNAGLKVRGVVPAVAADGIQRFAEGTDPYSLGAMNRSGSQIYDPFKGQAYAQSDRMPTNLGVTTGVNAGMSYAQQKPSVAMDFPRGNTPKMLPWNTFNPQQQQQRKPVQMPMTQLPPQQPSDHSKLGGYTTATTLMTGDAPQANPWDGGAMPELIHNPTGAPLMIKNSAQTAQALDMPQLGRSMESSYPETIQYGNDMMNRSITPELQQLLQSYFQQMNPQYGIRRFALGTDASQQYQNAGLGQLWLGSSDNSWTTGLDLPNKMQMLKDNGVPLAPGLVNSTMGQVSPTLNLGSAFAQRGGGVLPSMQALNKMTSGEREMFQGYSEGVVGVPWRDTIDFLSGATSGLATAQKSRGAY